MSDTPIGRIDVHSHLIPGVDDGCPNLEESFACGRAMVHAGYTHCFCTPHIWPNLAHNTVKGITERTVRLQEAFAEARIPLKLMPGGELSLRPDFTDVSPDEIPTYGMSRRYCIFDIWAEKLPEFFWPSVDWLKSQGLEVIIAHPERMRAVQHNPDLADEFAKAGLLMQGNLQCLGDPPHAQTRQVGERFLKEGRYFMLGSDTHNLAGWPLRLAGLENAIELVGEAEVWRLTRDNPRKLMEAI
ncbi:MAG TPA: CpsB/CapC family capsule biosynthesis tyrosine phosphatase [Tepidisphaeraceae bacterium]